MCPHLDIPLQIKEKNYKTLYKNVLDIPLQIKEKNYKTLYINVVNAYPHHRILVHYKHRQALVPD